MDVIEIMLQELYQKWNITDETRLEDLDVEDYPILFDF